MKIFTISSGEVEEGVKVEEFELKGARVKIPAIIIGESGRNRNLGIIPVRFSPKTAEEFKTTKVATLFNVNIVSTKSGKPAVQEISGDADDSQCVCVFRTKIGFRGSNTHCGDYCGTMDNYLPFPGKILVTGSIAQGDAGRMGQGLQVVATMPKDIWFSTCYTGRLYGDPPSHFYLFNGENITSVTLEEKQLLHSIHESDLLEFSS